MSSPDLAAQTSTLLGTLVKIESVAHGIQDGLKFLSLVLLGLGLPLVPFRFPWPPGEHVIPEARR